MVTRENVEQYRREGYTLVPELLSQREMDEIQAVLDPFIDDQVRLGRRPEHLDHPHIWNYRILQICKHPKILDAFEQFLGSNIALFATHVICKAKGDGLAVPWHQDGSYWPLEPMDVITLWLAVDPSTVENGCMKVIPGTHTAGSIEHVQTERPETKVLDRGLPANLIDEWKAVNCVLPRGGASFHAPWLFHGSTPNTSTQRRCGYTIRCMPPTTRLVRNGPTAKYFGEYPLFLLRGKDTTGTNVYANA
jgi:ectoine hydroxylase-related dioxygenase (phytanoyl-CoA dioxygenase family)